jgi:peptidoglycan/xylan/chitin deacetylase (PgdA/CDA1 family)
MPPASADPVRRLEVAGSEHPGVAWSIGLHVALPDSVIARAGLAGCISGDRLHVPSSARVDRADVAALRQRAAFTPQPPASSRLPVSYRSVPGPLRRAMAGALGRYQRGRSDKWAAFPMWPLDLSSDFLADLDGATTGGSGPTPIVLTHDLDSPEGLRNLVDRFLPIEEAHGARSTSFVVPSAWPLDHDLLAEAQTRGHELGIHGFDHANRTAFAPPDVRRERLLAGRALADRYQMDGYRAPSLLRTSELLADLDGMYRFDSSIPTSGGLFPVPNNGCATARPFYIGGVLEIPVSMPRDGSLQFLGYSPAEILALWQRCAGQIARSGGVVVLLTHCEDHFSGGRRMLEVYAAFLDWLSADERFTWSRASTITAQR